MGHLRRFRRQMGAASQGSKSGPNQPGGPERVDLEMSELEAILERSKVGPLNDQDCEQLRSVVQTLYFLTQELEKKHVSIQKLKQMLFGATTESTRKVMKKILDEMEQENKAGEDDKKTGSDSHPSPKAKGHGRNGAEAYSGAKTVTTDSLPAWLIDLPRENLFVGAVLLCNIATYAIEVSIARDGLPYLRSPARALAITPCDS